MAMLPPLPGRHVGKPTAVAGTKLLSSRAVSLCDTLIRDSQLPASGAQAVLRNWLEGGNSTWVDENWRLTFRFDGTDAEVVDYQDYH